MTAEEKLRVHARAILADDVLRYEITEAFVERLDIPRAIADVILAAAIKELTEPRVPAVGRF